MAEAVVSFLLATLTDVIAGEAALLLGVRDQVRTLHSELEWLRSFLRDADDKRRQNERVKTWVSQIRDVAYDAEDAIQSFLLTANLRRRRPLLLLLLRCSCSATVDTSLARNINDINRRIERIASNKSKYGIEDAVVVSHDRSTVAPAVPIVEEADVVGFEEDVRLLVERMVDEEMQRRAVVSIVGMGGLGKTTLARKVYNCSRVRDIFDCRAWVSVSQDYHAREILLSILRCIASLTEDEETAAETMGAHQLLEIMRGRLREKKYMIVVDDLWTREAWDLLDSALPRMRNGSRVLLTTRNRDVALYADPQCLPHELRCLGEEESWTLFCRKALVWNDIDTQCGFPLDMERVGREIAAKCCGLPLAIVVVAGLLSRKEFSLDEWQRVLKSFSWQLREGEDRIQDILALSYNDLPYYLKSCFLYISVFPEDSEIPRSKLVRLWVAEGFVERRGDEELEDVAEDYLLELIHRSLIKLVKRSSNGRVKACRVHDLLRDLAISEAREDRFLDHHGRVTSLVPPQLVGRRLVLHSGIDEYVPSSYFSSSHLRTLLCFTQDEVLRTKQQRSLYGSFKLLRVVDLNGVHVSKLPTEIGNLIHLRHLGLRETHLKELPSSICNLFNLQTLEIRNTSRISGPSGIWRLHNLRHIRIGWLTVPTDSRMGCLTNLQTLSTAVAGSWMQNELGKLSNIRKLALRGDLNLYSKVLSQSLVKLESLRSLRLRGENLVPALPPLSHSVHLYKLSLKGRLDALPELGGLPPNLTKVTLNSSRLEKDPMEMLGSLQNLRFLRLAWNAYIGREMTCSADGFPQLRALILEQLHEIEEWIVEEGALPRITSLLVRKCHQLKSLSDGLQRLSSLQALELWDMPEEIVAQLKEDKGSGQSKFQHISSITIKK